MILPIEKQVCSLELAKRLKELGVPKESYFKWHSVKGDREKDCYVTHDDAGYGYELCAAFTVAELGEMLPHKYQMVKGVSGDSWLVCQNGKMLTGPNSIAKTLADAMAQMVIYLIENKLVSPAPAAGGRREP